MRWDRAISRINWRPCQRICNDEQGTHIFDKIYSPPANLSAQVFDIEHSSVTEPEFRESLLVCRDNGNWPFPVYAISSTFGLWDSDSLPLD